MKLYAVYKDGELCQASYKHPSRFYENKKGAKMAMQSLTNRRCLPWDMFVNRENKYTQKDLDDYLAELKTHFDVHEFELIDKGVVK